MARQAGFGNVLLAGWLIFPGWVGCQLAGWLAGWLAIVVSPTWLATLIMWCGNFYAHFKYALLRRRLRLLLFINKINRAFWTWRWLAATSKETERACSFRKSRIRPMAEELTPRDSRHSAAYEWRSRLRQLQAACHTARSTFCQSEIKSLSAVRHF